MKITGSGPSAGPSQRRRVSGPSSERSATGFAEHVGAKPPASSGGAPSTPLATLEGVLVAQEITDPKEQRRRGVRHGHSLLAELRELQLGLVEGWVSEGTLRRLAGLLNGLRPTVEDPELDALLDDLELRAAVELAKLDRSLA
jgi:Class II flagellar assembly regulator